MELKFLDAAIDAPIADIVRFKECILVSSYDKHVRIYKKQQLVCSVELPEAAHRMAVHKENILLASMQGSIFVMDEEYNIVETLEAVSNISCIASYAEGVLVGSWNNAVAVIGLQQRPVESTAKDMENRENRENRKNREKKEHINVDALSDSIVEFKSSSSGNENENLREEKKSKINVINIDREFVYSLLSIRTTRKAVSAIAAHGDRFVVACENSVAVYDFAFNELYYKDVSFNINSMIIDNDDLFLGLISGKIQYECLGDKEKSFIFNAHTEMEGDQKVYHSVNHIVSEDGLYSAGSNGKILKWNMNIKTLLSIVFENPSHIKKFIIADDGIYIILEDLLQKKGVSRLVFKSL